MDDIVKNAGLDLYDTDFYAWTQAQAALLRQGRVSSLDLPNLLQKIESLGRKEAAELRSLYTGLAQHLFKEMFQPEKSGRSWRTTILNRRIAIARHMEENPSLKAKAGAVFEKAYADARELAASETGLPLSTFPDVSPFTREQAVRRDWLPARDA